MSNPSDLKPCPFCSGKAEILSAALVWGPSVYPGSLAVQCKSCMTAMISCFSTLSVPNDSTSLAVKKWNERKGEGILSVLDAPEHQKVEVTEQEILTVDITPVREALMIFRTKCFEKPSAASFDRALRIIDLLESVVPKATGPSDKVPSAVLPSTAACSSMTKRIGELEAERDEARDWCRRLQKTTQTLTCVYCGKEYPPGSPTHGAEVLTEHIRICEKHPMRVVESQLSSTQQECQKLVKALKAARKGFRDMLDTVEITITPYFGNELLQKMKVIDAALRAHAARAKEKG